MSDAVTYDEIELELGLLAVATERPIGERETHALLMAARPFPLHAIRSVVELYLIDAARPQTLTPQYLRAVAQEYLLFYAATTPDEDDDCEAASA